MRTIMEDLSPYLAEVTTTDNKSRYKILYVFNIQSLNGNERYHTVNMFNLLINRQNWHRTGTDTYEWETDSIALHNWFTGEQSKKEPVNDIPTENPCMEIVLDQNRGVEPIPDHMQDATRYAGRFKQEYQCEFKQMEKQVNKDKFSVTNKTYIKVNGKDFNLTSPFDAEASLGVILELTERLAVLNGNMLQLATINAEGDQTDAVQFDKVVSVATDEISDIKEMIDFINDNIEEVE